MTRPSGLDEEKKITAAANTGPRLPDVGQDRLKASDHVPLAMDLVLV